MANKKLNAVITIGGAVASSLTGAFGTVKKSIGQVGAELARLEREQRTLTSAIQTFGRQGKNVDSLRAKYAANVAAVDKLRAATERLQRVENARERNLGKRQQYKDGIMGTVALGATLAVPIKAAMDFESTMADIKKVVDAPQGENTDTFFKAMGKQILDMSKILPMTANEIGRIFAAGGQSGIATKDLAKFTESAVKMGVAFDISAEEAGQAMAELRSAFAMSQDQVNTLADQMNYLDNNGAAAAKNILEIVQRIGPLAKVAGVSAGQVAALGSTLRGMGVQNEIAATGIKNLFLALSAGNSATKSQREVFKRLGYTSTEVAKSMQLDAQKTIMVILKQIKKLNKADQAAALSQLFGKEVVGSIAPLLSNMDALQKSFDMVADKTKYAGSMQKEFEARAATTANQMILFRNQITSLGVTIGSVLLPAVNSVLKTVGPWIGQVTDLAEKYPVVTKAIVATAGALVTMKVATFALGFAWTFLKGGLLNAVGLLYRTSAAAALLGTTTTTAAAGPTLLGKAFLFLGRGIMLAGRMLLLNPIGLAITAIAAGALLIYENWDKLKPWFTALWKDITATFDAAITKITGWITAIADKWNTFKTTLSDGVGDAWKSTKNFFGVNDEGDSSKPGAPGAPGLTPPPAPQMANRSGGGSYTDNSQNTIQVTQRPGESNADLAKRITAEQERQRQIRQRSMMNDGVLSP